MFDPSKSKVILLLPTTTLDNESADIPELDTVIDGILWRNAAYYVYVGATDIALTALKLRERDAGGVVADVAGLVFGGGGGNPALPGATDDNKVYRLVRNFGKRLQTLVVTAGDGAVGVDITVVVVLWNPAMIGLDEQLEANPTADVEVAV